MTHSFIAPLEPRRLDERYMDRNLLGNYPVVDAPYELSIISANSGECLARPKSNRSVQIFNAPDSVVSPVMPNHLGTQLSRVLIRSVTIAYDALTKILNARPKATLHVIDVSTSPLAAQAAGKIDALGALCCR